MSKRHQRIDDGKQITIFDVLQEAKAKKVDDSGSMKCKDDIQAAMRRAIKGCPLSRHQIAGQMSHLLDEEITKAQIDAWTAESKNEDARRHIPGEYIPAFCRATDNYEAMDVLDQKVGRFSMDGKEAMRSEIHKMREEAKRLLREVRKREVCWRCLGEGSIIEEVFG